MRVSKNFLSIGIMSAVILALLVGSVSLAQVKQGKTRPMMTKYWMRGVMNPHCLALKKGLDAGPSDDKAWEELAVHAALLNEGSHVLMADSRCPDAVWAKAATETLRNGSAAVLKAIEEQDAAAAQKAFGEMTQACASCHKAHKKN